MAAAPGVVTFSSAFGVAETLDRLAALVVAKGFVVFARIDFARDARAVGEALREEQLLVFGNPKAGTPLLQASPAVGLDLPLTVPCRTGPACRSFRPTASTATCARRSRRRRSSST